MKLKSGTYLCFDTDIFIPIGGGTVKKFRRVEDRSLEQIKRVGKDVRNFYFFDYNAEGSIKKN